MDEITVVRELTADPQPPGRATAARAERLLDQRIRRHRHAERGTHARPTAGERVMNGGAVRARRPILAAAGALGVAAVAGAGVTALLLASPPARHATKVSLAAWSVAEQGHGDIRVTIRQLHDPAGLQARLRADGVPASVSFTSASLPAASCQPPRLSPSWTASTRSSGTTGRRCSSSTRRPSPAVSASTSTTTSRPVREHQGRTPEP